MYKIMLADDEGIVIDALKFIIEKEFGSLCQVEYAKTGRSVIELAESYRPDIAVMDIQMPGINGIEAMREIRTNNQNMVFIVMSAYDKFDYAKEAVKLSVLDYITKPIEKDRMIEVLKKAMELIEMERVKRSNDLRVREKLEMVVPIIESGMIYDILLQEHFMEDIADYKTLLGISADYAYMAVAVCGEEQDGNHMTNAVGSSVRIQRQSREIRMVLDEFFPNAIIGAAMANKIVLMVPYQESEMDYNARIAVIDQARAAARKLRQITECTFRMGIGPVTGLQELKESYREALDALIRTTEKVVHANDLPLRCEYEDSYPISLEDKLFAAVESGDDVQTEQYTADYFEWMIQNYPESIMETRLKVLEFILWAEHIAYQKGGMTYKFNTRQDYLPAVMNTSDMRDIKTWFVQKMGQAARNIRHKGNERSVSHLEKVKEYIHANYSKDISLEDVSRIINISPYYFSKIFKEDTGEGFIEYLTRIRMEKAKELLDTTDSSVKEICLRVGYADPNYFSRSFKMKVGVTPTEYKEKRT